MHSDELICGMEYSEEEYLPLSGIQHFAFCRRQWALIHIENVWTENSRTAEGRLLHEGAHDAYRPESRGETVVSRAMPVFSRTLGLSGECDLVELRRDEHDGVAIRGREGKYRVYPVEYKRGSPKEELCDLLQLTAQAMCLEEMLCCTIEEGALYYFETRHRLPVTITDELREKVRDCVKEMHADFDRRYLPKVRRTKACNACSLKEECLPRLEKTLSARRYNDLNLGADDEKTGDTT